MRRTHPPHQPSEGLRQFEEMWRAGLALKLFLPYLPEGSTTDDARRLYRRLTQQSRTPCSFLDADLGITR
jgi:hypothetical protein